MMYRYTAYTNDQRVVEGTIESMSQESAEASLYKAGFKHILNLKKASTQVDWKKLFMGKPKIKQQELLDFTNELVILTESGLTLLMALKQLERQATGGAFKSIVGNLSDEIQGGTPFYQSLKNYPQVFSETFCSVIEASEKAGSLDDGLKQLAKQIKQQIELKSQIMRSMTQPLIVGGLAVVVVIVMAVVVLPPLTAVFSQMGANLPITTRILMGFSDFISNYKLQLLIAIIIIVVGVMLFMKRPETKPLMDKLVLRSPVIGRVIIWHNTARIARTLSNLLAAGILLPDCINIMLRGIGNTQFRQALTDMRKELLQGQSFSRAIENNKLFPTLLSDMIGVGESSGNLEYALGTVADYFESKVEKRINRLTALLEPALTLGVGLVVGFLAVTMISTIYGLVGGGDHDFYYLRTGREYKVIF
jgi:type IV pilus assembly protein PilC